MICFSGGIESEVEYLLKLIKEELKYYDNMECLDVGCGTGAHAYRLAQNGINVTAGDISEDMLNVAKAKHEHEKIEYCILDATDFSVDSKYDIVLALSYVIGYQLSNKSVEMMLKNVYNSLSSGGIFILPDVLMPKITFWRTY